MIPFSLYFFLPNSHFLPPFGWARSFKVVGVKFPFEDTSLAHPCWTVPQTPAEMTPSPPPKAAHSTTWGSGWPCAPAHQAKSTSCGTYSSSITLIFGRSQRGERWLHMTVLLYFRILSPFLWTVHAGSPSCSSCAIISRHSLLPGWAPFTETPLNVSST